MKNILLLASTLALLLLIIGCSGEKKDGGAAAAEKANASRVVVKVDGSVLFDDQPVTLEELPAHFAGVKNRGGGIWYYREKSADGRPNPNFRVVLGYLIEAQIPVQIFGDSEFSKPVSMSGNAPAPAL